MDGKTLDRGSPRRRALGASVFPGISGGGRRNQSAGRDLNEDRPCFRPIGTLSEKQTNVEFDTGGTHWDAARNPSGRDVMVDHSQHEAVVCAQAAGHWPVKATYLRALTDLGMSDAQIARYFKVTSANVSTLRESFRDTA
jgi:hypothetical protein